MIATRVARRLTGRTFTSTSSLFNIDMVAEHTFKPGTELMEHPIDEPSKGISAIANFRAAAVGIIPSGQAFSNMNARRLTKQGAKKAKKGKKTAVNTVGDGMEWLEYDTFLATTQDHLSTCSKIFVDDSRNVGDLSARFITSDATTALMLYNVMEAVPKSKQASNFFNNGKQLTIYAAAEVKETAAVVATEDDSCKIILTGAAVCQTGLDAAVAAAVKSLMPTEE